AAAQVDAANIEHVLVAAETLDEQVGEAQLSAPVRSEERREYPPRPQTQAQLAGAAVDPDPRLAERVGGVAAQQRTAQCRAQGEQAGLIAHGGEAGADGGAETLAGEALQPARVGVAQL